MADKGEDVSVYTTNLNGQGGLLPIEIETNTLIGSCGFKGEPINGKVEIGYEVTELFRNKGYSVYY